jgi:CRISPR/Cas system-associated exonuclease Cas4 (RecB family)
MIKELLYTYLDRDDYESHAQTDVTFSPSYLTDCRRKIFYKKLAYEKSNPIERPSKLKMQMGNIIHEYIAKVLSDSPNIEYLEGEILKRSEWQGLTWYYKVDNKIKVGDKIYIIEAKSTYMAGWNDVKNEPKADHVLQLLLYLIFENVENGILFYVGRDSGYVAEYQFTKTGLLTLSHIALFLQNKITELINLKFDIENVILPVRDFPAFFKRTESLSTEFTKGKQHYKTDFHCAYCQYFDHCWNDVTSQLTKGQFFIDGEII